ncbi:hypothetical protein ALP75_204777 [Pseudomonas syringae pv. actinidiae]|nr:hypothetical protein ALP75_204777 [Pseudomonas syringae pv. actinidiae]
MAGLIEVFREQDFTWTDRVGGVGNDHVEFFFGGRYKAHAIVDDQVQTRIIKSATGVIGQELLAHLDHRGVDLDHGDVLDGQVLGDFAQHAAIAAANDQYTFGSAMSQNRHVSEHLVIDELIRFGGLDHTIQRHDPAHTRVLEDHQMLVLGAYFVQHFFHTKALAVAFVQRFLIIAHG